MFKKLFNLIIFSSLIFLGSCIEKHEAPDEPIKKPATPVRRTVLVYMEGRNNLYSAADDDLAEMRRAKLPDDCRLLVYRSVRGEDSPRLIEISNGSDDTLVEYPAGTSALEVEQMEKVINDAREFAPAGEFGIVLWSHSSGWRQKSPSLSRGYGLEDSWKIMSITDLATALNGKGLDFLFFDTCFMGSVEVAYELRNAAPLMVASVCEVPTDGMPYDKTIPHLFDNDIVSGLSKAIDATVDYYEESRSTRCPSTLSLIDLSKIGAIAEHMHPVIANPVEEEIQRFAVSTTYANLFFDLGQYVGALGGDSQVVSDAIIHERHTSYPIWGTLPLEHCSGLSVFIPSKDKTYESYGYNTLEWARFFNL